MKVRVGFGPGVAAAAALDAEGLYAVIDACESLGWDSIWFSERVTGPVLDPMACMAATAARTRRLRFGPSVLVMPGRDPVFLAKELATIDVLSHGRLVVALGSGAPTPAQTLPREVANAMTEEAAGLMKRLWTEDAVTHDGAHYRVHDVRLGTRPHRVPHPDVWFGGTSTAALRMTGRVGDGWLPSFITVDEYKQKADAIRTFATEAGRVMDEEHFGALVPYVPQRPSVEPARALAAVAKLRPGRAAEDVVAIGGHPALRSRLEALVDQGASKLLVVPIVPPADWIEELALARDAVCVPLEA